MTEPPSDLIIDCFDRFGRQVVAYRTWWNSHIRAQHGELGNGYTRVQETIEHPDFVLYDKDDPTRELFYRLLVSPDFHPGLYLKVCIAFNPAPRPGVVVTAHLSGRFGAKETPKWPLSNQ